MNSHRSLPPIMRINANILRSQKAEYYYRDSRDSRAGTGSKTTNPRCFSAFSENICGLHFRQWFTHNPLVKASLKTLFLFVLFAFYSHSPAFGSQSEAPIYVILWFD